MRISERTERRLWLLLPLLLIIVAGAVSTRLIPTPYIDVTDYGAIGTDAVDDTTAVAAAITAAKNGQTIWFPPATEYKIGALTIAKPITLKLDGATYTV